MSFVVCIQEVFMGFCCWFYMGAPMIRGMIRLFRLPCFLKLLYGGAELLKLFKACAHASWRSSQMPFAGCPDMQRALSALMEWRGWISRAVPGYGLAPHY